MLPFLKKNQDKSAGTGIIMKMREPDEKPDQDQDDPSAAIHACAQSLIDAVHKRDVAGVADAMKDAFDILESMPHEEAEHESVEPHSYDAQKED